MRTRERTAHAAGPDEGEAACPADPDPDQPPSSDPGDQPTLDLIDADGRLDAKALRWLHEAAGKALADLHPASGGEARVRIVCDAEISRLHEAHLGDPATTDVLTFDHAEDPHAPMDVDICVCLDEARRQADRGAGEVERELLLYIVHGALHCSGYNDRDERSARRMHMREDEILRAIGVGAIYAPDGPATGARS